MSVESIGAGLKTRLETITGLKVFAPGGLPDSINQFPTALILPGEMRYSVTFYPHRDYTFRAIILFTKSDSPSALNAMLDYVAEAGTYSVLAAIDGDNTLGGAADDCQVTRNLGIGSTTWGGYVYLSTEFEIIVWSK